MSLSAAIAAAVLAFALVAVAAEPAYEVVPSDAPGAQARVREVIFTYNSMDDLSAAVALLKEPLGRDTFFEPASRAHSEAGFGELKHRSRVSVISDTAFTAKSGDFATALVGPDYDMRNTFTRAATVKRSGDALLIDYFIESPSSWEHARRYHARMRLTPGQAILIPALVPRNKFAEKRFFKGEEKELVGVLFTFDGWIADQY